MYALCALKIQYKKNRFPHCEFLLRQTKDRLAYSHTTYVKNMRGLLTELHTQALKYTNIYTYKILSVQKRSYNMSHKASKNTAFHFLERLCCFLIKNRFPLHHLHVAFLYQYDIYHAIFVLNAVQMPVPPSQQKFFQVSAHYFLQNQ